MQLFGFIASMGLLGVAAGQATIDKAVPVVPSVTPAPSKMSIFRLGISRFITQDQLHALFPDANKLYNFNALSNAAIQFPSFAATGNDALDKLELAAFLAQTAYESDNFKTTEKYAKNTYPVGQYCDDTKYPCASGRRYHGRGAMQLSWNYNYYLAGQAFGLDLVNDPDLVARNEDVAWLTALWVWMTPQKDNRIIHKVVTTKGGFAQSTVIINGGLCPNKQNEKKRISNFLNMCKALNVQPQGATSCNM